LIKYRKIGSKEVKSHTFNKSNSILFIDLNYEKMQEKSPEIIM